MVSIDTYDVSRALIWLDRCCMLLPIAVAPRQWRAHVQAERRELTAANVDADGVLERIEEEDFRLPPAEWPFCVADYDQATPKIPASSSRKPWPGNRRTLTKLPLARSGSSSSKQ